MGAGPVLARLAPSPQPYVYARRDPFSEPDWRRLPGYRDVTRADWESAVWQRKHAVHDVNGLLRVFGTHLPASLASSIARDQRERATMPMLVPPQMLNTMQEQRLWEDPIRRYMLPAFDDRDPEWPSHPRAQRDSLHEAEMWAAEGLVHRYPTKVLVELVATCPQYCGHCTRMDLVGADVSSVAKRRFSSAPQARLASILRYLADTPSVRDVTVSGGDIANVPIAQLEAFLVALLDLPNIRDIRLATKSLAGMPQHVLDDEVRASFARVLRRARERRVDIAVHTHINHAHSVTPLVAKAARELLDLGFRDVRNQGVLLRGVNDSLESLLDLCFTLLDEAGIQPYYFYVCDLIPHAEHWRLALHEVQALQQALMGYLPGFATPRIVCDIPFVGKRWVHQAESYDRVRGISCWRKNYRTPLDDADTDALARRYAYYDPISTLPEEGRAFWAAHCASGVESTFP